MGCSAENVRSQTARGLDKLRAAYAGRTRPSSRRGDRCRERPGICSTAGGRRAVPPRRGTRRRCSRGPGGPGVTAGWRGRARWPARWSPRCRRRGRRRRRTADHRPYRHPAPPADATPGRPRPPSRPRLRCRSMARTRPRRSRTPCHQVGTPSKPSAPCRTLYLLDQTCVKVVSRSRSSGNAARRRCRRRSARALSDLLGGSGVVFIADPKTVSGPERDCDQRRRHRRNRPCPGGRRVRVRTDDPVARLPGRDGQELHVAPGRRELDGRRESQHPVDQLARPKVVR